MTRLNQQGFTLIELMIALTLGLIILAGVTSFIVSLLQTNSETIRNTRLNQELRAVAEIAARDIRRARSNIDPISNIGMGAAANTSWSTMTVNGSCLSYAFQEADASGTRVTTSRSINRDAANGRLRMNFGSTSCTAGNNISSQSINITALTVTQVTANQYDITVTGQLRGVADSPTRTYRTSVYVRSGSI